METVARGADAADAGHPRREADHVGEVPEQAALPVHLRRPKPDSQPHFLGCKQGLDLIAFKDRSLLTNTKHWQTSDQILLKNKQSF